MANTQKFENGTLIADLTEKRDGSFECFAGYKDDEYCSGMSVADRKVYKRKSSAVKFCENWIRA